MSGGGPEGLRNFLDECNYSPTYDYSKAVNVEFTTESGPTLFLSNSYWYQVLKFLGWGCVTPLTIFTFAPALMLLAATDSEPQDPPLSCALEFKPSEHIFDLPYLL